MKISRFISIILVVATAAATMSIVALAAGNLVVTPTNTQGFTTADTKPGGAVSFVVDASAPAGNGALRLTTDASTTSKAQYMHDTNTPLSSVTALGYWTKQVSAPFAGADASYQLPVCLGGFGAPSQTNPTGCIAFTTFVFEPYQSNGCCTSIPVGAWQQWDVAAGSFWSSRTANAGGSCTTTAGFGGAPFYTLPQIKAACPSAVVVGFGVNIGSNNPSYDVYTDLLNFNGTVYDFEPFAVATDKDQCKNGGFASVKRSDGSSFKNQGDCIQYVKTGK
ncbi:hypothetical protein BH10ACI2_BH10ACI2_16350 [soil metagenome]